MALDSRPLLSTVQMAFDIGLDEKGRKVTRRRSFSNVKADVAEQDVYDVAAAISDLQTHAVTQILLLERTELVNI